VPINITNYRGLLKVDNKSIDLKNRLNNKAAAAKAVDIKKITAKWMLASLIATGALLVATTLFAAENPYEKNYKSQNTGNLVSLEANPDTKMYVSNHKDKDNISMLESGYDMMGTTGFEAGAVPSEMALQHAKTIKADTVLVYTKYGAALTSSSKFDTYKEAAKKNGGEIDEKDLVEEDIQYKYYASYWAKLPPPLLGVHVIKLARPTEEGEKKDELKGLRVLAVIKGSPAEAAGILRGDMLLKLNDTDLNKAEELSKVVREHQGKSVAIAYERDGVMNTVKAQINQR
jgi:PDZ domain